MTFGAAKLLEPEVSELSLPRRILKSEDDVENWLMESRILLLEAIKKGPIIV